MDHIYSTRFLLKKIKIWLLLGLISFNYGCFSAFAMNYDAHNAQFRAAFDKYRNGRYDEALKGFLDIDKVGVSSGNLLYNIANCYFKLGKNGYAIAYYMKAKRLIPRDSDLKANYEYAMKKIVDRFELPPSAVFMNSLFFWAGVFTVSEWMAVIVILNLFFWSILLGCRFYKNDFLYWLRLLSLVLLICSISGLAYNISHDRNTGIVLAGEIDVFSGFDKDRTVLFKLHEGTSFSIDEAYEGWLKIQLVDGKMGWIPPDNVMRI